MKLLKALLFFSFLSGGLDVSAQQIRFRDGEVRVSGSYDVLRFFYWKFRLPAHYEGAENSCESMGFTEHIIAGSLLPMLQARLVQGPESTFEEWYVGCVSRFAVVKTQLAKPHEFGLKPEAGWQESWDSISDLEKREFILNILDVWIGPEFVMQELGMIGPDSSLRGQPLSLDGFVSVMISLPAEAGLGGDTSLSGIFQFYALVILTLPELRIH